MKSDYEKFRETGHSILYSARDVKKKFALLTAISCARICTTTCGISCPMCWHNIVWSARLEMLLLRLENCHRPIMCALWLPWVATGLVWPSSTISHEPVPSPYACSRLFRSSVTLLQFHAQAGPGNSQTWMLSSRQTVSLSWRQIRSNLITSIYLPKGRCHVRVTPSFVQPKPTYLYTLWRH